MAAEFKDPLFISDPSFCPYCGLILPLPNVEDAVKCRLCEYRQDSQGTYYFYVNYV